MGISRRNFLKGSVAAGASIAAMAGLAGCASPQQSQSSESKSDSGNGICKHTWEVKPEAITDISETKDYDVVVVGGGMAGTNAAQAAARFGASVAVLERNDAGRFCGLDMAAMGSKVLLDDGIEIDLEKAARIMHSTSQQTSNYHLIKTWLDQCGPKIDYITELCAENGVSVIRSVAGSSKAGWDDLPEKYTVFNDSVCFSSDEWGVFDRPDGKEPHQNLGDVLVKSAEENGAEFFFNTHAEQLVGDAENGITGVIATDADGKHVQFNASKGVVIATGDIGGNDEMLNAWSPIATRADANVYTPAGANTGDGILMGCWAGAAISKSPASPMIHPFTIQTRDYNLTGFMLTLLAVNQNGDRFMNEMPFEPYVTDGRMNQPGNVAWSIFDANYGDVLKSHWGDSYETRMAAAPEEIETRLQNGTLVKADTVAELAEKIGVPAKNLEKAVADFDAAYEKGEDTQFGVASRFLSSLHTPPYYAQPLNAALLVVCFGLHVDDNSQVCTEDDTPIKGLYACGNAQGDFFGFNYPITCPGCSTSRSLVYGQLIGEALAKNTTITELVGE